MGADEELKDHNVAFSKKSLSAFLSLYTQHFAIL